MTYERSPLMQHRMDQTRQAIFESALTLIGQEGLQNTQISAIATMAGVSNGSVYRYFKNKSEIMIAVLRHVADIEIAILNDIADGKLASADKLHRAVLVFVKRALNSPQMAYSLMLEPADDEAFEAVRLVVKQGIAKAIEKILAAGKQEGVFMAHDIKITALCIVGAMTYSVIEPLNANQNSPFDESYRVYFSQQVADFCLSSAKVRA